MTIHTQNIGLIKYEPNIGPNQHPMILIILVVQIGFITTQDIEIESYCIIGLVFFLVIQFKFINNLISIKH